MQPKKHGENHRTAGQYSFPDIGHLIKQLISLSFRRSWRARHSSSSKTFCGIPHNGGRAALALAVRGRHLPTATAEDLIHRIAAFEADVNADPGAVADRLWVKDHLDPEEEKLRFSK